MDFTLLLLLALPLAVAAVVVAVSAARRRGRTPTGGAAEPEHRFQAGTAAVQDAAAPSPPAAPRATSARQRRAESGDRQHDR